MNDKATNPPADASPLADPLLTPQAVCARYSLADQTLRNWRCTGKGPRFVKLPGGAVRYRQSDLLEWEIMTFKQFPGGTEALAA